MKTKKLTLSALFVAFGTISSHLIYIPVAGAKCFPIQHTINVLSAVLLGPWYGVVNAALISLLRNILGTGSLLAFPGSMIGTLLAGLLYRKFNNYNYAALGEVIGTGLIGSLLAFPIAKFLLGQQSGAFVFIIPFGVSTLGGTLIALLVIKVLLPKLKQQKITL